MKSKYAKFGCVLERVPVQFGKASARERKCYDLGWVKHEGGDIPEWIKNEYGAERVVIGYYRIAEWERGAGTFFEVWRWRDRENRPWETRRTLTYRQLPDEIKRAIGGG